MRRKLLVLVIVILGLAAGILFTAAYPPFYTSQAIVCVSAGSSCAVSPGGEWDPASLAIMVSSEPVLAGAAHRLGLNTDVSELNGKLHVTYVGRVFTLTAKGRDPGESRAMATAVAGSFGHFLSIHDHVIKKGLRTRTRFALIVLTPARWGIAQRPLGSYAETTGLGLLGGWLLAFLVVRPSRREVRRGYRTAFRLIFGRGRIATNILELLDGPDSEGEHKARQHAGRDRRLDGRHGGRAEDSRELANQIDWAS